MVSRRGGADCVGAPFGATSPPGRWVCPRPRPSRVAASPRPPRSSAAPLRSSRPHSCPSAAPTYSATHPWSSWARAPW